MADADWCSGRRKQGSGRVAAAAAAGTHTSFPVMEQAVKLRWTGSLQDPPAMLAQTHLRPQPTMTLHADGARKASGPAPAPASPAASPTASQPAAAACGQQRGCSPGPAQACPATAWKTGCALQRETLNPKPCSKLTVGQVLSSGLKSLPVRQQASVPDRRTAAAPAAAAAGARGALSG